MVQQGRLRTVAEFPEVGASRNEPVTTLRPVELIVALPAQNPNLQKLNAGSVKFKLASKPAKAVVPSGVTLEEEEEEGETEAVNNIAVLCIGSNQNTCELHMFYLSR